jgi:hypothetical protein
VSDQRVGHPTGEPTTPETRRAVYRGLYFNPTREDDLEILGWLLAVPRASRARAIKTVLRAGLPSYVAAQYPDRAPLNAEAVHRQLREDTRRRHAPPPSAQARSGPVPRQSMQASEPSEVYPRALASESALAGGPQQPPAETTDSPREGLDRTRADAEARLDRLLRSYLR